jgi:hypothetical protein
MTRAGTWLAVLWCLAGVQAFADLRVPHVIGSDMVLQRDQPAPIWG